MEKLTIVIVDDEQDDFTLMNRAIVTKYTNAHFARILPILLKITD